MKCEICGKSIETTFLGKVLGTSIRDSKSKKRTVCKDCQRMGVEEMRKKL